MRKIDGLSALLDVGIVAHHFDRLTRSALQIARQRRNIPTTTMITTHPSGKKQRDLGRRKNGLQGAKKFVQLVGSVEVGFEFTGGQTLAKLVEAPGE